jgi:hypothetical protein
VGKSILCVEPSGCARGAPSPSDRRDLVSVDRWTLAEELWSFGEDDLYLAALDLSDEEMIQVWKRGGVST